MDQTELARALAAQNDNLQLVLNDSRDQKARLLDVEQKLSKRPVGGSFDQDQDLILPAFEASEGLKALKRGETRSARISIPGRALERKATITSQITGGTIAAPARATAITAPAERRLMVRDLLPSVPVEHAGATEFVRELSFSNGASPQTAEGAVKAASDMTFELITSPLVTIASHQTVSRQALDDAPALQSFIETRGIYGWQLELEEELLIGDGSAGTLDGLVNNATPFNRGSPGLTPLDAIRKAITQLALSNHVASGIVLNPVDAETLELAKDSTGQYLGVVIYVNGSPFVWRVAIVESNTMTAGQFLAGAFDMAATVRTRQEAHVEISLDHADYRTRNLALILIEGRIGLEVHSPSALVKGAMSYP